MHYRFKRVSLRPQAYFTKPNQIHMLEATEIMIYLCSNDYNLVYIDETYVSDDQIKPYAWMKVGDCQPKAVQ